MPSSAPAAAAVLSPALNAAHHRAAPQIPALCAAGFAPHHISPSIIAAFLRRERLRQPLRSASDLGTERFPHAVMAMALPGQHRRRCVRILVPRRFQKIRVISAQKLRNPNFHRPVALKAADAALPAHPLGKRQPDFRRVNPEVAVEPVIFFS